MFGMKSVSSNNALSFMICAKFLKNHMFACKCRGFRVFRFLTDTFCLRTSCNIHCHCLEDTCTTEETFSQKGRDRHDRGRIFH